MCDACGVHLAKTYLENCFHVYSVIKPLALADQKEIIEGIACVVSVLPPGDKLNAGLHRFALPVVNELNAIIAATNGEPTQAIKDRT